MTVPETISITGFLLMQNHFCKKINRKMITNSTDSKTFNLHHVKSVIIFAEMVT